MDRILVIGGAGGIGSAIVDRYHRKGMYVIVGDIDKGVGERLLSKYPTNTEFQYVDLLDTISMEEFRKRIYDNHDYLTHLVSLAGGAVEGEFGKLEQTSKEGISDSIDLNLKSHLYLIKDFVPLLEKAPQENRSIVLMSSINAQKDFGLPAYSAAKAGMYGMMYALTSELGEKDIRINTVSPGTVPTPRTLEQPKDFLGIAKGTALGRLATVDDIADAVYAVTHELKAMTGQDITIDCGQVRKPGKWRTI